MRKKNNQLDNIKYQHPKVSKPVAERQPEQQQQFKNMLNQPKYPPEGQLKQTMDTRQRLQPSSERKPKREFSKEKLPSPIHAPKTFKYAGTFDRIQAELHELLNQPESVIPAELLYNNPELERIVGTAYVVEESLEQKRKSVSHLGGPGQMEVVMETNEQQPPSTMERQHHRNVDKRQGRVPEPVSPAHRHNQYGDLYIPSVRCVQSQESPASFEFVPESNYARSQFF